MLGDDFSRISCVSGYLASRGTDRFCFKLSFHQCLHGTWPGKRDSTSLQNKGKVCCIIKVMLPFRAKGSFIAAQYKALSS